MSSGAHQCGILFSSSHCLRSLTKLAIISNGLQKQIKLAKARSYAGIMSISIKELEVNLTA